MWAHAGLLHKQEFVTREQDAGEGRPLLRQVAGIALQESLAAIALRLRRRSLEQREVGLSQAGILFGVLRTFVARAPAWA